MRFLYKRGALLSLLCLTAQINLAEAGSADSLRITIYHAEEISGLQNLPEIFPRHRPAKLLLKGEGRVRSTATTLQIVDSLAALQKLAGLPYFSHTEKTMKTLFKSSEVIPHPNAAQAVADPVFHILPLDTVIYIRQVDNRLGTVIYRAEIAAHNRQVSFCATNVVPVKKLGLQLAEIGDCILFIAIQKEGEYLDFTAWQWLRFKGGLLGTFVKEESFVNRLKAVGGFYLKALTHK